MTVATDAPFTAEELAPTLRPLLEASLLPPRAYVDEDVAPLEHAHAQAGAGQVGGGGQAVVAAADDDRVIHRVVSVGAHGPAPYSILTL